MRASSVASEEHSWAFMLAARHFGFHVSLDGSEGSDGYAGGGKGTQGSIAGVKGGAGSESVVHKQDVPGMDKGLPGRFPVKSGTLGSRIPGTRDGKKPGTKKGHLKGGGDVAGFLLDGKLGLSAGATGTEENVGAAADGRGEIPSSDSVLLGMTSRDSVLPGMTSRVIGRSGAGSVQGSANRLGENFGLVVATGATAGPMEGNREDEVHIGKVGSRSDAPAEKGAIKTAGIKVPVVFQGAGDGAVRAFVVHEGRSVGIVHALGGVPVPLQDGIEAVGKGVVRLQPIIGVRDVGRTGKAQVPLAESEAAPASEALARKKKVQQGAKKKRHGNHCFRFFRRPPVSSE